jgi:hypothetical protein
MVPLKVSIPFLSEPPLRMAVIVIFGVLRVIISLVMGFYALMMLLAILAIAVGIVSGVISAVIPDRRADPSVSVVVPALDAPASAWHRTPPHRGSRPLPPLAAIAMPCGVGHGNAVELVACGGPRADVLGFAVQEAPHGRQRDCLGDLDAYSKGAGWWVCWIPLPGARINPWPDSPNPFRVSPRLGGVLDGDR